MSVSTINNDFSIITKLKKKKQFRVEQAKTRLSYKTDWWKIFCHLVIIYYNKVGSGRNGNLNSYTAVGLFSTAQAGL